MLASIVGVPVLVACVPGWLRRWTLPMLAVSSVGVYLTVPDTDHVRPLMLLVVLVAIVTYVMGVDTPALVGAAIAFVMISAAIADSAGRAAPMARSTGCFGALLALPVAQWSAGRAGRGVRPALTWVLGVHCVVAVFSSRVLIRQSSASLVVGAVTVALGAGVVVLRAVARP